MSEYPIDWEGRVRALLEGKVDDATIAQVVDIVDDSRWERYYDGMAAQREIDYEYRS